MDTLNGESAFKNNITTQRLKHMLNIFFWLVFGMLIGWIAILIGSNADTHILRVLVSTTLGAVLGGSGLQFIASGQLIGHYNPSSIVAAVAVAAGVATIILYIRQRALSSEE